MSMGTQVTGVVDSVSGRTPPQAFLDELKEGKTETAQKVA